MVTNRFATFFLAILALLAGLAPAARADRGDLKPVSVERSINPRAHGGAVLVVHYFRPDDEYQSWNLWTWPEGGDGRADTFNERTEFGRYAIVPVDEDLDRIGLIVRRGNWEAKDVGQDRWIDLDDDGLTEIWLISADERVYTDPDAIEYSITLTNAFLDGSDRVHLIATGPLDTRQLRSVTITDDGEPTRYRVRSVDRSRAPAMGHLVYEVRFDPPVETQDVASLTINVPGMEPQIVYAREVLTEDRFTALDAPLGAFCAPDSTTFRIWSPVSESVDLLLYDEINDPSPARTIPLTRKERGIWETTVMGDLHDVAYMYRYRSYGKDRIAPDIHTFAANAETTRSVVVDLARTNPAGWNESEPPILATPTNEVIYEIHVRDFTVADPSVDNDHRATYLGIVHEGEAHAVSTGLSHLKDLGVTAVHLLPIHDFPGPREQYNWGYWTTFFNAPEGNYSTNPRDPAQGIRDLKQMIQTLHENDIRIILDVVYNHTSSSFEWSPFYQSVPYYYFRTTIDGQLTNDAGVGNSIADERPMVRKFIVDSTKYWITEYKIDGMRFDLIGTHEPDTVRAVTQALLELRPDITLYGEPWTGGGPVRFGKGAQRAMRMAVFNDHLRNAIRGDLDGDGTGFATGPAGDIGGVRRGVAGAIDDFTNHPIETVNYVSAHDNLTLWDKISRVNPRASDAQKQAMQKLAIGIVLTSQGIAFLHGGSDFARTKGGNHNSYNAGDQVNKFDWARKAEYEQMHDYVAGLIELRRACPLFRFDDAQTIRKRLRFLDAPGLVAFTLDGSGIDDDWREVVVAYNPNPKRESLNLPSGQWELIVDDEQAGTRTLRNVRSGIELPAYSMVVLRRSGR